MILEEQVINEISSVLGKMTEEVIKIADKNGLERDEVLKETARVFSGMTEVATYKEYRYGVFDWKEELFEGVQDYQGWIPCEERYPDTTDYILLSFSNFTIPVIGRWEEDEDGGAFYVGDDTESCVSHGMIVNAWQQLPKVYRPEEEVQETKGVRTRIECMRSMSVDELADKVLTSEVGSMIDFCQNFSKCENIMERNEEIPDEMCKKCLVKWLNSPVERQKTIPTEHFKERFSRVV